METMRIWFCKQPGNINWLAKLEKARKRGGAVWRRTKSSRNRSTRGASGEPVTVSNTGMKQGRRRYLNIKEHNIRIAALNVHGVRKPHKVLALGGYLAFLEPQPDICELTGTHLSEWGGQMNTDRNICNSTKKLPKERGCKTGMWGCTFSSQKKGRAICRKTTTQNFNGP